MGEGAEPEELYLIRQIRRYDAANVLGRPMSALEIKRIGIAENIANICVERGQALNAAIWMTDNPDKASVFNYAMKKAIEMGLINA